MYNGQLRTSCRTRTVIYSSSSLSSTSRSMGPWSDKHACEKPMLTDPDKQATQHAIFFRRDVQGGSNASIPDWSQPFAVNLEELEMYVLAHSSEREISDSEGDASKLWIQKWKHSIHTNFRKYRKRSIPWTEEIGDLKTVERKSDSRNDHQFAPVVQKPFSGCYPRETKTSQETEKSLRKFLEPSQKPKDIYTDNSLEFGKSCEELSWIIGHPLLFDQKQTELQNEPYDE